MRVVPVHRCGTIRPLWPDICCCDSRFTRLFAKMISWIKNISVGFCARWTGLCRTGSSTDKKFWKSRSIQLLLWQISEVITANSIYIFISFYRAIYRSEFFSLQSYPRRELLNSIYFLRRGLYWCIELSKFMNTYKLARSSGPNYIYF